MTTSPPNYKDFYYPPGGILLWIIIFLELFTFGIACAFFLTEGKDSFNEFNNSANKLNQILGAVNTAVLLISGYFAALTIKHFKKQAINKSKNSLLLTISGGLVFVLLKSYEYLEKFNDGFTIMYNDFFTFYWLLTVFHLVHVLVGLVILIVIYRTMMIKGKDLDQMDLEAGTAFWHMCDLIWLMLFPVLYLFFL